MKLVERHIVKKTSTYWLEIDRLCSRSKNLYNRANYFLRQHFFSTGEILSYPKMDKRMQVEESYCALPRKVSQAILRVIDRNWKAWKEATKSYKKDRSKFLGCPRLPKYKDKESGRYLLIYTIQAISQVELRKGIVKLSQTSIRIKSQQRQIQEVRVVPKLDHYVVEVIYNQESSSSRGEGIAAIDIGIDNLVAVTSNQRGFTPFLINGRPIKSINQFYNQRRWQLQIQLKKHQKTSRRIQRLSTARNFKIDDYLHKFSRFLIDRLVNHQIGTLIIGKNDEWRQEANLNKRSKLNFVKLPHAKFIQMLAYKAELAGMKVVFIDESYTSKASFLDLDPFPVDRSDKISPQFSGTRIQRGLYQSREGRLINADLNGSYNILRKVIPNAFAEEIERCVVHPVKFTLAN